MSIVLVGYRILFKFNQCKDFRNNSVVLVE